MLCSDTSCTTVGTSEKTKENALGRIRSFSSFVLPEYNRNIDFSTRHVKGFRGGIDDLYKNIG